ncbi:MAG: hypothetical protein Kow00109_07950 [Acidobacteriota bacterium]
MVRRNLLVLVVLVVGGLWAQACRQEAAPEPQIEWEKWIDPEIFWADPKVIQVCDGDLGETTLYWKVMARTTVEVHVERPDGPLFAQGGAEGNAKTGKWVRDGMWFFLTDPERDEVIAACRVRLTKAGCPEEAPAETPGEAGLETES